MRKQVFVIPSLVVLIYLLVQTYSCSNYNSNVDPPDMWGQLEQGPYSVGFKTQFHYDQSRPAIPYSDWNGKLYPTQESEGRQMQINIWYPAIVAQRGERILFEHYVDLFGQQTDFGVLDERKKEFASQEFIRRVNALGGGGRFTPASLDSLEELTTHAFLDAEAVERQFPLVVFPNGSGPAIQSIMCEYLASHGFIVATVALKGEHAFTDDASFKGVEMAVIDLDFAVQRLLEIPEVDKEKVGLIGNAINSSQIIAYQSRNSNIDCVISLEGGLLSSFEQNILKKTAFYNIEAVNIPILAIYAPHPSIDPSYIYHLKYADRYFFHFPQMTEFHFLNFGQFERFVPNIIGAHNGDVQKGYELASFYSLKFLEAFLTDNQKSLAVLGDIVPADIAMHIDTSFVKKAIPRIANISLLKSAYDASGFQYIDSLYWAQKELDEAPYSRSFYADMKDWLAWQKDPEFKDRYQLYKLAFDSYPNNAEVNYYLSYYAMQIGDNETSKFHIRKAMSILEKNENPELTIGRKERLKRGLLEFLAEQAN